MTLSLPAHDKMADNFEDCSNKAFGEDVGLLFLGVDLVDLDVAFCDLIAKEMVFDGNVLGARRHARTRGKN